MGSKFCEPERSGWSCGANAADLEGEKFRWHINGDWNSHIVDNKVAACPSHSKAVNEALCWPIEWLSFSGKSTFIEKKRKPTESSGFGGEIGDSRCQARCHAVCKTRWVSGIGGDPAKGRNTRTSFYLLKQTTSARPTFWFFLMPNHVNMCNLPLTLNNLNPCSIYSIIELLNSTLTLVFFYYNNLGQLVYPKRPLNVV